MYIFYENKLIDISSFVPLKFIGHALQLIAVKVLP